VRPPHPSSLASGAALALASLFLSAAALANVPPPGFDEVQDLAKAGRSAEALRKLDALIGKHPQDLQLRFQKGVLLVEQKRTAEAIALFERMAREHPTLPEPLNNLAVLYAEQGQIEKARTALESAVRSRPSYDTAYQNLASVNVRMASRAYAKALQIDDSTGTPKLALLKSLTGSHQDSVVTVAAAPPPPSPPTSPSPAPAPAPAPATAPAPTPAPADAPAPPRPDPGEGGNGSGNGSTGANPATANAGQRRQTDDAREVQNAVRAWAQAWERKDMNAYIGAYVPGFKGSDGSASAWQSNRRQRILGKSRISVELSGITVELLPGSAAKVSFRQDYAADQLKASSTKVLELVKRDGRWLIRKESVGS
jgi:tetratricopeptide (TPR) repeat protein